jgi:hypothetical protein
MKKSKESEIYCNIHKARHWVMPQASWFFHIFTYETHYKMITHFRPNLKMCFLFRLSDVSFYEFPIHATCTAYPIHVDLKIVEFIIK